MINDNNMQRLAFVKYLYGLAVNQSKQPEPLSSASILAFHDSVEFFLQIASEYLNISIPNNLPFLDYWDKLNSKLNTKVTQKEAMKRLNKSRVALKHHGTLPSKLDVEGFRVNVTNFFNENCFILFKVEFENISLISLIKSNKAKDCLEEATKLMSSNQFSEALVQIGISFNHIIDEYENIQKDHFGRSPFFFGENLTIDDSYDMNIEDGKLSKYIDNVGKSIKSMQSAIKILSLGLDYRRYSKFKLLTPFIRKTLAGTYTSDITRSQGFTHEQCKYCINFVIDSALRLQDIEFPED